MNWRAMFEWIRTWRPWRKRFDFRATVRVDDRYVTVQVDWETAQASAAARSIALDRLFAQARRQLEEAMNAAREVA